MAYVKAFNTSDTPDDEVITGNNTQSTTNNPTNPSIVSGSNVSGDSGTTGNTQPLAATVNSNAQPAKGMFTNLEEYLTKNDQGANALGNTLGSSVQGKTDTATNAVAGATTDFNNQVGTKTNNYDSNFWNGVAGDASEYLNNDQVKTDLSGSYGGITDITNTDAGKAASDALTKAQSDGLLSKNVEGRTQLFDNIFNKGDAPKTTTGGLALDQFLVQNTQPAYDKVVAAGTNADALTGTFKDALDASLGTVKTAQATNLATRQAALDRLGQGLNSKQQEITAALKAKQDAANAAAATKNQQVQSTLDQINQGRGGLGQAAADLLGISLTDLNWLQQTAAENIRLGGPGATVGNYINAATGGNFGTADAASQDQVADLLALNQLQGLTDKFLVNGQAGNAGSINYQGLGNDIYGQYQAGVAREAARVEAARVEAERQAEVARQQAAAQAQADAEAQRVAALSVDTGNPWANAANQALIRGDQASYNYYMILAKQLSGYMQTQNRIANNGAAAESPYGNLSQGGGSGGVGEGGSPTASATDGIGTGIGNTAAGIGGTAAGIGIGMAGLAAPPGLSSAVAAANSVANAVAAANAGGPGSPGSAGNSGAAAGVGNGTAGSPGGNTGQEGNASNGNGNGGSSGGSGGSCVMATALVANGQWGSANKNELVDWCHAKLHGTKFGECLRRGYQVLGAKIGVPAVRKQSFLSKYYQWTFEQITKTLTGRKFNPLSIPNTVAWLIAVMVTGSLVSTKYAKATYKALYKDKKDEE